MKNNPALEKPPEGKKWLYHPAIGYYRPSGVDKATGVPMIEILEEWKVDKNGALIEIKRFNTGVEL